MENYYSKISESIKKHKALVSFLYVLAFLLIRPPVMLTYFPIYNKYDVYAKMIVVLGICFCFFLRFLNTKKEFLYFAAMNLYFILIAASTLINGGDIKLALWGSMILGNAMAMLICIGISDDAENFLKTIYYMHIILIILNLFTVLNYAPKEFDHWQYGTMNDKMLFGMYNGFIQWMLPAQVLGYIIRNKYENKNNFFLVGYILLCLIILFTLFYVGSATSIVTFLILDIFLPAFNNKKAQKIFNLTTAISANVLLFIYIVILRADNRLTEFIVKIFGKNITFSGRTYIWDETIKWIKKSPIIGNGIEFREFRAEKIEAPSASYAHNLGIETAYRGGALGCMALAAYIIIAVKDVFKVPETKIKGALTMFVFCFLLDSLFEAHPDIVTIITFSLIYFISALFIENKGYN